MLSKFNWITLLYTNLQEDAVLEIHYFKTRDQNSISRACFSFCLHSHSKVTFVCHVFALLWKHCSQCGVYLEKGMGVIKVFHVCWKGDSSPKITIDIHLIIFNDFLSSVEHTTRYFVQVRGHQMVTNIFKIFSLCFGRRWKVIQIWGK